MLAFAKDLPDAALPRGRRAGGSDALTRERVLACAVRLLDRGFFRIGTEEYAESNESFGLATMRKQHVTLEDDDTMVFDYPAKCGKRQMRAVVDPVGDRGRRQAQAPPRRRRRAARLQARAAAGTTCARTTSTSTSRRSRAPATPPRTSAPGTRPCWRRSRLAVSGEVAGTKTGRKRAISRAVKEVSHYLGNTPAVCRASYIDPRVFDAYEGGLIIRPALEEAAEAAAGELAIHQPALEKAVLDLIDERASAPGDREARRLAFGRCTSSSSP